MDFDDELDRISNLCLELVSERKHESMLLRLFRDRPAGLWVPLAELDLPRDDYPVSLKVSWVNTPDPKYAIVLFFDSETLWSMHADYNLSRLLRISPAGTVASSSSPTPG
jgi:hypothetical protein